MFKNRVRTAALAGAIAVATGVSGLTVPANAEVTNPETGTQGSNPQTDNHLNPADSSKGSQADEAKNIATVEGALAVEQLQKKADADKKAIKDLKAVENYAPSADRPIEDEVKADAVKREAAATEALQNATSTLNAVNTTLKAVQGEVKAANDAWEKYATAITLSEDELKELQKLAKKLGTPALDSDVYNMIVLAGRSHFRSAKPGEQDFFKQVLPVRGSTVNPTQVEYVLALQERINNGLLDEVNASNKTADKYSIDRINALTQVNDLLLSYVTFDEAEIAALKKDAVAKSTQATSRNAGVLQEIAAQARAQVRALRVIQAYYGFAARWADLYENDVLTTDEVQTLRKDYWDALFTTVAGGESLYDQARKAQADISTPATIGAWDAYASLKWENEVQRVRLLDKRYKADADAKAADDAAKKAAATDLNTQIAKIAEELAKLNEAKAAGNNGTAPAPGNNNGGNTNTTPSTDDTKDSSSTWFIVDGKLQPAGIAAIVLGVVAALGGIVAFAFPQIQTFLKF